MKTFGVVIVLFGIVIATGMAALTAEQRHDFEKNLLQQCKESTDGATDDDVNTLLEHENPTTDSAKCLAACAQEKVGIIQDGKISVDSFKALGAKKYEDNAKAIEIFNELVDECANVTGSNKCELSGKLIECMIEATKKRGIDSKKGIEV